MRGGLPEEILRFFRGSGGGHSLIVKGAPGAGKSVFALQLATELRDSFAAFYVSRLPRVQCFDRGHAKRTSDGGDVSRVQADLRFAARTELNRLIGDIREGSQSPSIPLDLPEIEMAYEVVDENLARYRNCGSLILIDPVDALDDDYDIRSWRLVTTLQKDLVDNSGVEIVYIVNSAAEQKLDYLADAVVMMFSIGAATTGMRALDIEKLRGRPVQQRRYYFTVRHGRLWEAKKDFLEWMERL